MHEVSVAQELVATVAKVAAEHRARAVTSVSVAIGELAGVVPDALELAFAMVTRGTIAEGAKLVCQRTPLTVACTACGREGPGSLEELGCTACGAPVRVTGGRELRLCTIDVEDDDHA